MWESKLPANGRIGWQWESEASWTVSCGMIELDCLDCLAQSSIQIHIGLHMPALQRRTALDRLLIRLVLQAKLSELQNDTIVVVAAVHRQPVVQTFQDSWNQSHSAAVSWCRCFLMHSNVLEASTCVRLPYLPLKSTRLLWKALKLLWEFWGWIPRRSRIYTRLWLTQCYVSRRAHETVTFLLT